MSSKSFVPKPDLRKGFVIVGKSVFLRARERIGEGIADRCG